MRRATLEPRDRKTNFFIKKEKLDVDKYNDLRTFEPMRPDPRGIFAGSMKVNTEMKRRLSYLEHDLFELEGDGKFLPHGRIFGKGLNSHQRHAALEKHWGAFTSPVCTKLDMSRWDRHFNNSLRKIEHSLYIGKFRGDKIFKELLDWQYEVRCYGFAGKRDMQNKFKFNVEGIQPSGCVNTGLGNSLIVTSIMWSYCKHYGIDARLFDDGDDILLICDEKQHHKLSKLPEWCQAIGTKLTLENTVRDFNDLVFCQCRPFHGKMIRSPSRVLGRALGGRTGWGKQHADMFVSVGLCEYIANKQVPIVSALMYRVYEVGLGKGGNFNQGLLMEHKKDEDLVGLRIRESKTYKYEPPTLSHRESFQRMYGCTIEMQIAMEERFNNLTFEYLDLLQQDDYVTLLKINPSDLAQIIGLPVQL